MSSLSARYRLLSGLSPSLFSSCETWSLFPRIPSLVFSGDRGSVGLRGRYHSGGVCWVSRRCPFLATLSGGSLSHWAVQHAVLLLPCSVPGVMNVLAFGRIFILNLFRSYDGYHRQGLIRPSVWTPSHSVSRSSLWLWGMLLIYLFAIQVATTFPSMSRLCETH